MFDESDLTKDQNLAVDRLFDYDETLLIAPTGAGKTVVFLTAAAALIDAGVLNRILVIAPLKVCQTAWTSEAAKWSHLSGLEIAIATGAPTARVKAFCSRAQIVVINEENAVWFFDLIADFPAGVDFDGIVIDETGKWGDTGGTRFKKLRKETKEFKWRVGMTAQPVSENWVSLFAQTLLIDLGKRFGRSRDRFLRKHFYTTDYEGYNWELLPTHDEQIVEKLADLVHVMPDYKGDLPAKTVSLVPLEIGPSPMAIYNQMRIHCVTTLLSGDKIQAQNQAVLSGKLEQLASGFAYLVEDPETARPAQRTHTRLHLAKQAWIEQRSNEILDASESVIIVYWYAADLKWLRSLHPGAFELTAGADVPTVMAEWQKYTGQVMFLHPASAGHGVDGLQDTCFRQLWIGPVWSHDKTQQVIDRIWRRGQKHPVEIEIAIAKGTIDEVKWEVCEGKGEHLELFLAHLGPESAGQTLESGGD
jgi:hypothetical protein